MRQIKIVFWNVGANKVENEISVLLKVERPDVLILCESENIDENLLLSNNMKKISCFIIKRLKKETRVYSKKSVNCNKIEENDKERYSINELEIENEKVLMVVLHLPSKTTGELEQHEAARAILNRLDQKIEHLKKQTSIEHVIYVGDFNMNPYEKPLNEDVSIRTSNCLKSRDTVESRGYVKTLYYNPCYHLLGNINNPVQGTYYYNYNWGVLDQVLLSKSIQDRFDLNEFKILLLSADQLSAKGLPNKRVSDHLPIRFVIN